MKCIRYYFFQSFIPVNSKLLLLNGRTEAFCFFAPEKNDDEKMARGRGSNCTGSLHCTYRYQLVYRLMSQRISILNYTVL